jgi:hypothetical protein
MRRFGWGLIVAGLLIAVGWPLYVHLTRHAAMEEVRPLIEKMSTDGPGIPGGPWEQQRTAALLRVAEARDMSPWAGTGAGAAITAFGILLLAIRRPDPPSRS